MKRKLAGTRMPASLIVKCHSPEQRSELAAEYMKNGDKRISTNNRLCYDVIQINGQLDQALKHYGGHQCVKYAEPNYFRYLKAAPNDPYYARQYGLKKIKAESAWSKTLGSAGRLIAVVDTGVDRNHPDLKNKLVSGYNFVAGSERWDDDNGHGTHVAGIAAASTGNGIGIAGVAQLNRILPIKSFDSRGVGTADSIAQGIIYAADKGAKVLNMSFGSYELSRLEQEACAYAVTKGVVLVAAAGNDGSTAPFYPAAFHDVISVAATDSSDQKAAFSNYGLWVDVAAPGAEIISADLNSGYKLMSGTSMAAPFVSGIAGLLAAEGKSRSQIMEAITSTASRIAGTGNYWRHGLVNAGQAVQAIPAAAVPESARSVNPRAAGRSAIGSRSRRRDRSAATKPPYLPLLQSIVSIRPQGRYSGRKPRSV